MNAPTAKSGLIVFEAERKNKRALIKYSRTQGVSMKSVMNTLLVRFLDQQLDKDLIAHAKSRGA